MEMVGTIRLAPTVEATGIRLHIWTMVNPARSNSLTIVAPQRVQVPHVEPMMMASTLSCLSRGMISWAMRLASASVVPVPTVE
ncbi:hypothetical protein CE91St41_05170 [Oscillospiraceae bacterium]|nr:hypothetical protein CE91St41_05170 [Oscillospiraceae bacterium]